jgi:mono/diheme cytochrome c family protein
VKLSPILVVLLVILGISMLGGCGTSVDKSTPSGTPTTFSGANENPWNLTIPAAGGTHPTYTYLQANVFQPKCAGCHTGGSASGGYRVDSYAGASSTTFVTGGSPLKSTLYYDLSKGIMPMGGGMLSDADLANVYTWIAQGALNN